MNIYRVFYSVPYVIEINAETEEQAIELASEREIGDFIHDTTDGEWSVDLIGKLNTGEKTDGKNNR